MSPRTKPWIVAIAIYLLFVFWYTDFGGPLSEEEIVHYRQALAARGMQEEGLAQMETFMREDTGRQFLMVNLIDNNETPPDVEGAEPGESAGELMDRYMAYMYPELFKRASHPTVAGDAVSLSVERLGIDRNMREWDFAALMRYRSRRTLMEIIANAEQGDSHKYKLAALNKTIAFPIETQFNLGDPRFLLALILLVVVLVINRFQERARED